MNNWKGERMDVVEYNSVAAEHLHRYAIALDIVKNKRVLDIASGEGYGSNIMASVALNVTGVDISKEAVMHARKKYCNRPNLSYVQGSMKQIPLTDNSVDVVVSFESIEHAIEHDEIMLEIKRVLIPGGVLVMSTPDKYQYTDLPGYKNPFHIKELYQEEFRKLVEKYFKHSQFFAQRFYSGSFIVPMDVETSKVKMFSGDYDVINDYDSVSEPLYIVVVASDNNIHYSTISFFDLTAKIQHTYHHNFDRLLNSTSYRFGHFFIGKLAFVRDKFKKRK